MSDNRGLFKREQVIVGGHLSKRRYEFYGDDTVRVSRIVHSGTAQAGGANTITLAASASASNDAYATYGIRLTAGTGSGQDQLRVLSYNGSTKIATLSSTWQTVPDSTSAYDIINRGY